ncbi:gamma-glutamyl-CDP-amidate hydrolase [Helicobacter sp.]|uniref:gamma-glutamyl-CDP-amidate hydrolase n=1 Tax=Helicobacter sp. TaxID=218 RepID=UPI0025B87431|nr:gamma-glutamyl-CDP-amidate hydrolase [Helicobacter sp.]MBR2494330.1 gamma-glutamyl-gamma-aminobutyrate hydrolase family protein [Helicobacter sp.]
MFIAITQRLVESSHKEVRECLASEWGEFFARNLTSYLPLPLAYHISFAQYAPFVRGVILSGGNDLACFCNDELSIKRDSYEMAVLEHCVKHRVPVLGVCRGAQMIAQYFSCEIVPLQGHIGEHSIEVQGRSYKVNSFHNYCVRSVSSELESIALASDASVEAFRHRELPIFGMMWHIERSGGMEYDELWQSFLHTLKERN